MTQELRAEILSDHASGDMTQWQLRVLEYFLTRHFPSDKKLATLETGCGNSTLLFAQHSARHHVYFQSDDPHTRETVETVRGLPGLSSDQIRLFAGPTVLNLLSTQLEGGVDMAVIGGVKTHPTPDAEYFAIRPLLRRDSILVLRDTHIPTIRSLYDILCEDDAFHLTHKIEDTVFFWCKSALVNEAEGSSWQAQRYNTQRLHAIDRTPYKVNAILPVKYEFDGWLRQLPSFFERGFGLISGQPVATGALAVLELPVTEAPHQKVEVVVELQCSQPDPYAWMQVDVGSATTGAMLIADSEVKRLRLEAEIPENGIIEIKLHQGIHNPQSAAEGDGARKPTAVLAAHRSPLFVRSFAARALAGDVQSADATSVVATEGAVVSFTASGQELNFFVHDRHDSIQAHHAAGHLYESEELALIAKHLPAGARVLDVGANIGNHTVWFEKCAAASFVVPVEPQPRIVKHLKLNCALNNLKTVDLSYLGIALGTNDAKGTAHIAQAFNPAGAVVSADPSGDISIRHGDTVLGGLDFDFVKIDTEGAELGVVQGIRNLIMRCRPTIFVEVANENRAEFLVLMQSLGYLVVDEFRRYEESSNLLLKHS